MRIRARRYGSRYRPRAVATASALAASRLKNQMPGLPSRTTYVRTLSSGKRERTGCGGVGGSGSHPARGAGGLGRGPARGAGEGADRRGGGGAGRRGGGLRRSGGQGREQPQLAGRGGDLVVLGLEAERARHPAAARV